MSDIAKKMRAAVIAAPGRCEVRTVDVPVPSRDQVLVRVEGCGMCGSSLPRWEGRPWFHYPGEPGSPGHEGWGRVVAAGAGVRDVVVGERVCFLSEHAFAEYDVSDAFVKLPAELGDVPGEPLGCAMNIWRRSDIQRGQNVAVIGAGFMGLLLTQLAAKAGANVIVISQRSYSREMAVRVAGAGSGSIDVIELGASDGDVVTCVEELTDGQGCERVLEMVGMQRPLDIATRLTRARGRLVIAGFHQDGMRSVDMFHWNWRGLDVINAHERDAKHCIEGMRAAIDAVATGRLEPAPLYTDRVPLAEAGAAFDLLSTRPSGFVKALVTP